MTELSERLRQLDRFEPPDIWPDVESRGPRPPQEEPPSPIRKAGVLVVAFAIGVTSIVLVQRAFSERGAGPAGTPSPTVSIVPPAANGDLAFDCGYHLCTVSLDGSGMKDLIKPYSEDLVLSASMPVFSPDGSRVAFHGYPRGATSGGANYDLYVMNTDGSGLTNLTGPNDDQSQDSPRWSPDGSMLAYNGDDGIYVVSADGTGQRKLANGGNPEWSPDGDWIVFALGSQHGADLWKIHPDGTGLTQITSGSYDELPTWSPDGARIAFVRHNAIYVVNADGTGLTDLADLKGVYPFQPAWAPDSTRLAFEAEVQANTGSQGQDGTNYDIFVVNADGTGLVDITPNTHRDENFPVWAPDGTRIAFGASEVMTGDNTGTYDLYTMRPDGAGEQRLTHGAGLGVEFDIAWQPLRGQPPA